MIWLAPLVAEVRKRTPHSFPTVTLQCLPSHIAEIYSQPCPPQPGVHLAVITRDGKLRLQSAINAEFNKIKGVPNLSEFSTFLFSFPHFHHFVETIVTFAIAMCFFQKILELLFVLTGLFSLPIIFLSLTLASI